MKKERIKQTEAVSPVVGVMLMLVVTIIIAAVVSGFAGGLSGSQEMAPQASIAVSTAYVSDGNFDIKFEHQGGDAIKTSDCEFITFLTLPNGTVIKHTQTPSSALARSESPTQLAGSASYSRGPHLTDPQKYAYPCNPILDKSLPSGWTVKGIDGTLENGENYAWFGNAVWIAGDVARTYNNGFTANFIGLVDYVKPDGDTENPYPGTDAVYNSACSLLEECVDNNCNLEIKMLHVPSGKYILDKSIVLQG